MIVSGAVHKYGDNVDTDVILPGAYMNLSTPETLGKHCMEDLDMEFLNRIQPGDIIVAGENFGCGSSREQAALAIKGSGIGAVVAVSFARIFFRNAINIGLPIFECVEAVCGTQNGDHMEVNLTSGTIINKTKNKTCHSTPFPSFLMEIIECGGLVEYTRRRLIGQ
jgi:3-isopropylmalate/(R)-2-methylmalate dehydratase small subunit